MARGRKKGSKVHPDTGVTLTPEEYKEQVENAPKVETEVKTEEAPQEDVAQPYEIVEEEYVPSKKKAIKSKEKPFEFKDRYYYLKGNKEPVAHFLKSKKIMWFDEEYGGEREIMFTENMNTPFVDEFKGEVRPARIIFRDGTLHVPKTKVVWQKILSIYHSDLGKTYLERDEEKDAMDELSIIELELEAMNMAKNMDITKAESIVRMKEGSSVSKMSVKEIKRSLMLFCKENPQLVIDLAEDENVEARNLGIKAVEQRVLLLSSDHRTFMWGSNKRKLFDIPFNEHPYSALVQWFKTDEGLDVYSQLEKIVV